MDNQGTDHYADLMNFGFTEEQEILRSEVRKFIDEHAPLEEVRRITDAPEGFSRELWSRMGGLGWLGLTIPEAHGGSGTGLVTLVVLLEEMGRTLFPSPLVSQVLAARAIERRGSEDQKQRLLPALADGSCVATVALLEEVDRYDPAGMALVAAPEGGSERLRGRKTFVADGAAADLFVVAYRSSAGAGEEGVSLAVVEKGAAGVSVEDLPPVDPSKRLAHLILDGVEVDDGARLGARGAAWGTVADLVDVGATLVTAEAVGSAEGGLALTTSYARERLQFGSPIGRFQGVKHPLAEMFVDVESFKSLVYYAAWALDQGAADASLAASRAKAYASEVMPNYGLQGVELHGGIGYTWEYDIQLFLKRARWMRPMFGDADHHYERVAALGGL